MFYAANTPVEQLCTFQYSLVTLIPGQPIHSRFRVSPSDAEPDCLDSAVDQPRGLGFAVAGRTVSAARKAVELADERQVQLDPVPRTAAGRLRQGTRTVSSGFGSGYGSTDLHAFLQDSFFQPYLPLQQIDLLKTRTYLVGTTNSIFQQQRECHIDVLVNVCRLTLRMPRPCPSLTRLDPLQIDSATLEILNPKLTALVTLTAADRKWMDEIVTTVDQSWNAADPSRPLGQGFIGSDDFIRAKFEEYVCSLLACVKFGDFLSKERGERVEMLLSAPGEPLPLSSVSGV